MHVPPDSVAAKIVVRVLGVLVDRLFRLFAILADARKLSERVDIVRRQGMRMICRIVDVRMSPSAMGWDDGDTEVLATARCYGPYEDYMDQVVLTNVSQNINLHYGDTGEPIPPSLEIISMRADLGGEEMAKSDGYDGIYTACPALTAKDFAWPK